MKARERSPQVLFIAGVHRSGTTLLDRVLGAGDGYLAAGELHHLWRNLIRDWRCGCGAPLRSCVFWNEVRDQAFGRDGHDQWREITEFQHRRLHSRPVKLSRLLAHRRRSDGGNRDSELDHYVEVLARLYRAVAAVGGAEVVIDSSKGPHDAYLVTGMDEVETYVLHLVRDPRGVAFSNARRVPNPVTRSQLMSTPPPLLNAARWLTWHVVIETIVRPAAGGRYLRLPYEEFAAAPVQAARQIYEFLGRETLAPTLSHGIMELGQNHAIAGSYSLYAQNEVEIKPDLRWRNEATAGTKLPATLFGLPLLRRYGYPVMPPRATMHASRSDSRF